MLDTDSQVDRNYDAFAVQLPDLLKTNPGQFVLMNDAAIRGFFSSALAAVDEGARRYGLGKFSVQQVTSEAENLGFYSYAGGALQA